MNIYYSITDNVLNEDLYMVLFPYPLVIIISPILGLLFVKFKFYFSKILDE